MKLKIVLLAAFLPLLVGCHSNGLNKLLGNDDPGTPYTPPHGPDAVANAVPIYDQTTATAAQDDNLILHTLGTPGTASFNAYVNETWLPQRMNGVSNSMPGVGISSILVDAWKALYRRGYADVSKLNDPAVIHSNVYPVPVYQDNAARWGL